MGWKRHSVGKKYELKAPSVIGEYCFIGQNAVIGEYTTIADNSKILSGANIKNSILWGNVEVLKNVNLDNCIIGYGAKVSEDISVYEGTVLNIE